jgi:hypothetical protein
VDYEKNNRRTVQAYVAKDDITQEQANMILATPQVA